MAEHEHIIRPINCHWALWRLLEVCMILLALALGFWASTSPLELKLIPTSPLHLLLFGVALLGSIFIFRKPEIGLLLLLALVYGNASEIGVRNYGMPSELQTLGIILGLAILVRLLYMPNESLQSNTILVLLTLYVVVLFGSSVYAINSTLADEKLLEHVKCLLLFALVINLVRTRKTLERAIWALVLSGAALGTISAYQVITSSYGWDFGGFGRVKIAQIVGNLREPRIAGAFADPNFYAQILIPLVPLGIYRLLDAKSWRWKLAGACSLTACLIALIFTYSRGGILALGVVLGLILIIQKPNLRYCTAGVALLLILLLMAPPEFQQRLGTLNQLVTDEESPIVDTDSSFRQRSLLMRVAVDIWEDHPILGVGAGNYSEYYQEHAERIGSTVDSYEDFGRRRFPHSLYLEIAAETGLVGLLLFAAIVVVAYRNGMNAVRVFRKLQDFKTSRLVMSLLLGLAGYLTTSIFLHAHYLRHLWLLLALIAASSQIAKDTVANQKQGES